MHGLLVALLLWSGPEAPTADEYADQAEAEYTGGDLARSIELIQQAYALDPKAEYLYMWAQAERSAGQCNRALPLYREFLSRGEEFDPKDRARAMAAATKGVEICEQEVEPGEEITPALLAARPREPESPPVDEEPLPVEERAQPRALETPRPRPRVDPLGVSLTVVGGVMVVAGGVLGSIALYDRSTATDADDEVRYAQQVGREPALRWTGVGLLAGGALVLGGGIARLLIVRKKPRATAIRLAPTLGGGVVTGRF